VQVTIRNQARHLLICTLNSGRTIHLAPSETSQPLQHLEINGNEKIDKLVRTGLVSIATKDVEEKEAKEEIEEKEDTEEKTAAPTARRQRKEKE
jgi:hypothetical protein